IATASCSKDGRAGTSTTGVRLATGGIIVPPETESTSRQHPSIPKFKRYSVEFQLNSLDGRPRGCTVDPRRLFRSVRQEQARARETTSFGGEKGTETRQWKRSRVVWRAT